MEWDVRIDTTPQQAEEIVNNLKEIGELLEYALVSGIEEPDDVSYGSNNRHVHIALIFKYGLQRYQVLQHCRGNIPFSDEYAVPRNQRYTYAGWYLHHSKWGAKIPTESSIRYEFGILPEDPFDEETKDKVKRMYSKFGTEDPVQASVNKVKFQRWLD